MSQAQHGGLRDADDALDTRLTSLSRSPQPTASGGFFIVVNKKYGQATKPTPIDLQPGPQGTPDAARSPADVYPA